MGEGEHFEIEDDFTVVVPARRIPRRLRLHAFAALMIVGALFGGALRLLPTTNVHAASNTTSCTAK
jgi:hypothetical protein